LEYRYRTDAENTTIPLATAAETIIGRLAPRWTTNR